MSVTKTVAYPKKFKEGILFYGQENLGVFEIFSSKT